MSSRMNKYYDSSLEEVPTRYHRNEELYKEISKNEIDNFEIKSNSTLLGENNNEIDVEKIKKILDTKYNETAQRKSIRIEEEVEPEKVVEDTKEYDINVILEKAKEEKQENYEEERLKKLRNTQFVILKNLNVEDSEEEKEEEEYLDEDEDTKAEEVIKPSNDSFEEENLKTLINTIAFNESKNNSKEKDISNSLDILSDLKGDDNTEVLDGLKEEITEIEDVMDTEELEETKSDMTNSFYTSSNALKQKDFEDLEDFKGDLEPSGIFLKVVIVIIVLVFLVGVGLLIKSLYFS